MFQNVRSKFRQTRENNKFSRRKGGVTRCSGDSCRGGASTPEVSGNRVARLPDVNKGPICQSKPMFKRRAM